MTEKTCSICARPLEIKKGADGKVYWDNGNNAAPINCGRCCDLCNFNIVIPMRIRTMEGAARTMARKGKIV